MKNLLDVARKNDFNLIETSVLFELDRNYPRAVPVEEVTNNGQIDKSLDNLITKGFIEIRWNKCRIIKN